MFVDTTPTQQQLLAMEQSKEARIVELRSIIELLTKEVHLFCCARVIV
jgi:hypothetical protein